MEPKSLIVRLAIGVAAIALTPTDAVWAQAATGTVQASPFDAEVAAAKAAMMGDPETALAHARAATALSRRIPNASGRLIGEATGYWLEGEALIRVNQPQQARPAIDRGFAIVSRHASGTKLHADLLKARAGLSQITGAVQSALSDLVAAHAIYRRVGETRSQAIVLQIMGSIYLEAHDFERALRYYEQANETYSDDPALTLAAHNNRGNAYRELGRHENAEREFNLALEGARALRSDLLQARILTNLATAQILRGQLAQAESTARLGLQISQRSAAGWEPYLWGVLARVYLERGDLQTARRYTERAFAGVDFETSTLPFREYHDTARHVYFRLGDAVTAFRHLTAFKRLDDEARTIAASANAALMTARFDTTNQELRIARLKATELEREAALAAQQQRYERLRSVGLVALLAALALFIGGFIAFRAIHRSRNRVAAANVKLTYMARHDALTGLPNRRYVRELLEEKLSGGADCAFILMDLDRFKAINDTLGHDAGDALLLEVGQRIHRLLPEGAHAARLGGDEFAAIMPTTSEPELVSTVSSIIESLSQPFELNGSTASIGASAGIAIGVARADTVDVVTRNADIALYHSKHNGRGKHTFFESWMLAEAEERRCVEADLKIALIQNQLSLAYQPIVDADSGEVVAFEALLRWQHPTRGEVLPSTFISIAEDAGLIRQIGEWVLRTACAEAARWPDHVKLAVNLSVIQIEAEGLVSTVVSALAQSGLPAERLEFEVTESTFLGEGQAASRTLAALRALGVSLALDDFGTGYSSLGYLQRTEFTKIKIDRSFVRLAAEGNEESLAIIKAIVSMAKGLGIATTAEGVETEVERDLVRSLGCSQIQGFLIGRPLRHEDAPAPDAGKDGETFELTVLDVPMGRRQGSRRPRAA